MNLEKYLITENASILEAIEKININGSRFILIINHKKEVVGLATDGDIRRAILRKVSLNNNITNAMNKDFFFLNSKKDKIKDPDNYINFIPIIDIRTKKLKDILFLDEHVHQTDYPNIPALIMAGGFGKRLKPLTNDTPKPMLEIAEHKQRNKQPDSKVSFSLADCLSLPFDDNSVDVVTIAFGLRNLEDRAQGLAEIRRVLRKEHGALLILEFSQPDRWLRPFYYTYLKYILPSLASMTTRNASAYHYLAGSIEQFPNKGKLCEEILHAGFSSVQAAGLTGSIVAVHEAMV